MKSIKIHTNMVEFCYLNAQGGATAAALVRQQHHNKQQDRLYN